MIIKYIIEYFGYFHTCNWVNMLIIYYHRIEYYESCIMDDSLLHQIFISYEQIYGLIQVDVLLSVFLLIFKRTNETQNLISIK